MKRLILLLCILFLSCGGGGGGNGSGPPNPDPVVPVTLTGITIDWTTLVKAAKGSDNFATTWAWDDNQYTTWGDGWGFEGLSSKCSLGVSAIWGGFENQTYDDLWWEGNGKSYGILGVNSALIIWVGEWGSMETAWNRTRLYLSTDWGLSWALCSWNFIKAHGFHTPTFLQAGQNYEDAQDDYVYSYAGSNNLNAIYCFRVHKDHILEWAYYEYYTGTGWSYDINQMQPILTGGALDHCSVIYIKELNKYVMATQHTESCKGNLLLLQSDTPWGPFTEFYRTSGLGGETFYFSFSPKWTSGKEFVMIYTGINEEDAYHAIKGRFLID